MTVQRKQTGYRKVRSQSDVGEFTDDVELLRPERSLDEDDHLYQASEEEGRLSEQKHRRVSSSIESHAPQDEFSHAKPIIVGNKSRASIRKPFLSGWRVGAIVSLVGATLVCISNLILTLHVRNGPYQRENGSIGTLFQGSCAKARSLNVWIHLLVNVLSTLLLSASNYCMQVLSAPTHEELVRAHARRIWLHIGVPSLRNLRHIGRLRAILWVVLFVSSMPLHLLFNSVIFTNLQANEYVIMPVTEDWLSGGGYDTSGFIDVSTVRTDAIVANITSNRTSAADPRYRRIDTATCFDTYNDQYVANTGNVYIVHEKPIVWRSLDNWWPRFYANDTFDWHRVSLDDTGTSEERSATAGAVLPFKSQPDFYPSNGWRCPSHTVKTCDVSNKHEIPSNIADWQPYEVPVKYCMVEDVPEQCRLQFSFLIATLVIASNFVKAACMALILVMYRRHLPLVTLGDAIAHFLDHPDPETKGQCLFSRELIEAQWEWESCNGVKKASRVVAPEPFIPKRRKWRKAPSQGRWLATYVLYVVAILFGIVCIVRTLADLPKDPRKLWEIGFGKITGNNLLNVNATLGGGILLANMPQAVLSYLYLAFNALYTNMFVGKEWTTYMDARKPLRVTSPIGQQRATYWLNVPFRYAIPMTILSGLFHWLTSQSIFLVQVTILDAYERQPYRKISTCGLSPVAIIMCTILGTIIAVGGFVMGRFRYAPGMPVVGSCSAAISAACHPLPEDTDASLMPVQWGAVTSGERSGGGQPVGHCAFSSLPVEIPIPGRLYA